VTTGGDVVEVVEVATPVSVWILSGVWVPDRVRLDVLLPPWELADTVMELKVDSRAEDVGVLLQEP